MKWTVLIIIFGILSLSCGSLTGPFLMWGHEKVRNVKVSPLREADERSLSTLFAEAKAVIIFVKSSSSRLDGIKYPKLRQMISQNYWTYLTQHYLAVEPFDYNDNVEVIDLFGSASHQDTEITSLFKDSAVKYGEGNVLGIMAYLDDEQIFDQHKREANGESATTAITTMEKPIEFNFIYRAAGKAILYTSNAPLLNMHINGQLHSYALMERDKECTFDDRYDWSHLNVGFKANNTRLRLRFNFTMSASQYWSLQSVEVEYKEYRNTMPLIGPEVVAPKGYSFKCSTHTLFFRNEKNNLTIHDFQVQPWLMGANRFSDAYDCIGLTTAAIWSVLFISTLLLGMLCIGIVALIDIGPPKYFESSCIKQLIFTIQE